MIDSTVLPPETVVEVIAAALRAEQRPDHAARERVEREVEADERRRDVLVDVELVDVERVDGEHVAVRRVALRRRRAAPGLLAVVVADVERALGQLAAAAGAARQLGGRTRAGSPAASARTRCGSARPGRSR